MRAAHSRRSYSYRRRDGRLITVPAAKVKATTVKRTKVKATTVKPTVVTWRS